MPLLKREPNSHPPEVLHLPVCEQRHWWLLRSRPQQEKSLMRSLRARELSFHAPVVHQIYRSPSGRLRESFLPLFPGYVFLYGDREDCLRATATRRVLEFQEIPDSAEFLSGLFTLNRLLAGSALCTLTTGELDDESAVTLLPVLDGDMALPPDEGGDITVNVQLCPLLPRIRLRVTRSAARSAR